jgi:hypothetical protein
LNHPRLKNDKSAKITYISFNILAIDYWLNMKYLKLSAVGTLVICAAASMTACVSTDGVSVPVSFPAASQYKLKSAAHWKLIAEDVAAQIKQPLVAQSQTATPVYIEEPAQPTPFERNFSPMLRDALLAQGLKVSTQNKDAAILKVQLNKVSHVATYRTGTLTFLGGSLLVMRDIITHDSTILTNAGGALAAISADMAMTHLRPPPDLEMVLAVSVQKDGQYLASNTQIYYLLSEDQYMYQNPPIPPTPAPSSRGFSVKGTGDSR